MEKPTLHKKEYFDFLEMMKFVQDKYSIYIRDYAGTFKNGIVNDVEYQDFWSFMLDYIDVSNGVIRKLSWEDLKDCAEYDWQREICDLFIAEFGSDYINILFHW